MPEGLSAVTVMGAMAPRQIMNEWTKESARILETFAARCAPTAPLFDLWRNYAVVIPEQLREHIQDAGWTKRDIAEPVYERARIRRAE